MTLRQDLEADALVADTADTEAHLTEQEFIRDCLDVARGRGLDAQVVQALWDTALIKGEMNSEADLSAALAELMIDLGL